MRTFKSIRGVLAGAPLAILVGIAPLAAAAAGLDGSANLVCAAHNVVACTTSSVCVQGDAGTFEVPSFMFVDFKAKVVRARITGDATQVETSPIRNLTKSNTQLVLQGVENGHGWGMTIEEAGGRMTTTVSGELVSYIIFGACTAL